MRDKFICPRCRAISYHYKDIEHQYCGQCRAFTGDWPISDERFAALVEQFARLAGSGVDLQPILLEMASASDATVRAAGPLLVKRFSRNTTIPM